MSRQDTKDTRSDLIALLLCVCIIGGVALSTSIPSNAFANLLHRSPTPLLDLPDASAMLHEIITNYDDSGYISSISSQALNPEAYKALARAASDYGATNDLLYVADLMKQFNDGAGIDKLRETVAIVDDINERSSD